MNNFKSKSAGNACHSTEIFHWTVKFIKASKDTVLRSFNAFFIESFVRKSPIRLRANPDVATQNCPWAWKRRDAWLSVAVALCVALVWIYFTG